MELEVLELVVLENDVSESTTEKKAPVLSFEEWDVGKRGEWAQISATAPTVEDHTAIDSL